MSLHHRTPTAALPRLKDSNASPSATRSSTGRLRSVDSGRPASAPDVTPSRPVTASLQTQLQAHVFTLPLRADSVGHGRNSQAPLGINKSSVQPSRSSADTPSPSLKLHDLPIKSITAQKPGANGDSDCFKVHFKRTRVPSESIHQNFDGAAVFMLNGKELPLRSHIIDLETDQASVKCKSAWLDRSELAHAWKIIKAFETPSEEVQKKKQALAKPARLPQQTPSGDAFVPKRNVAYNVWHRERLRSHAGTTPDTIRILSRPDARDLVFSNAFIDRNSTFDVWQIRDRRAGMIQSTGVVQSKPCSKCVKNIPKGSAPFNSCVVREGVAGDACACCVFGPSNEACDFHTAGKAENGHRNPEKEHVAGLASYTPLLETAAQEEIMGDASHGEHNNSTGGLPSRKRKRNDDHRLPERRVRRAPSRDITELENAQGVAADPFFPPGWRHPKCGFVPKPCVKSKRTVELLPGDANRAMISRTRVFERGEATRAEVAFIMSRASCRKLEVIHQVWKKRTARGPLPEHCSEKVDFVRFLMTDMLNEMVADFCPEVIELN